MRPSIIAVILILAACTSAWAQEPELVLEQLPQTDRRETEAPASSVQVAAVPKQPSRWQFGMTAGYLHSSDNWVIISGGYPYNANGNMRSHAGFTIGFSASYPFGNIWSFDTGANLSLWGSYYRDSQVSLHSDRYMLEIPLMITLFERDAILPIFIQAGLLPGILLGGRLKASGGDVAWPNIKAGNAFNRLSLSAVFGIGYGHFSFQYIRGLTNRWSRNIGSVMESHAGFTINRQASHAYVVTYTFWF